MELVIGEIDELLDAKQWNVCRSLGVIALQRLKDDPAPFPGRYLMAHLAARCFETIVPFLNEYRILQSVKTA